MAPIEPDLANSNLRPIYILLTYFLAREGLLILILHTCYRAYTSLVPSQSTRHRQSSRSKHVLLFASLAALSSVLSYHYMHSFLTLSYKVWAHERGEEFPDRFWGSGGIFGSSDERVRLELGRWFEDSTIFKDSWEVVVQSSRRFWWSQQVLLGSVAWSVFLSVEGRRRNIPHLWAYMLLSQMVGVSFAQNVFFVTILLTPSPLLDENGLSLKSKGTSHRRKGTKSNHGLGESLRKKEATVEAAGQSAYFFTQDMIRQWFPTKPLYWTPHPVVDILPLTISYICIFLLPFASNTPSFTPILVTPHVLFYFPLVLRSIVPLSWGTVHSSTELAHRATTATLRFISIGSFLLHGKATLVALLDNAPESHYYRRSIFFYHVEEHRSKFEQGSTAVTKVLGALADHPAVNSVGWDVLLSGLSLILWATVRNLDVIAMLEGSALYSRVNEVLLGKATELANNVREEQALHTASSNRGKVKPKSSTQSGLAGLARRSTRISKLEQEKSSDTDEDFVPDTGGDDDSVADMNEIEVEDDLTEETEAGALAWGLVTLGGLGVGSAGVFGGEVISR
ncbi:MAG: hypothetical protein M1827_001118 [Pycnora praestabilis]|nr:MAG: hypothetical protein M1827_001118 [Pycnora praestabilis]